MLKSNFFPRNIYAHRRLVEIDRLSAQFREIIPLYTKFKEELMKKYAIFALTLILMASFLAGCRNPNQDMDTNPGITSTPTGNTTEATKEHRETKPQTTEPITLPQTDPTAEDSTLGTDESGTDAGAEGRSRRRMPGM